MTDRHMEEGMITLRECVEFVTYLILAAGLIASYPLVYWVLS